MPKKKGEDKKFSTDEEISALLKIKEYKDICEENIVGILWKEPDLYFYYDDLKNEDFGSNKWGLYFEIGKNIIIKEQKILDKSTVDTYLNKHSEMSAKYENYGGFETIKEISENAKKENLEGYIKELEKWGLVSKLCKAKFPITHMLKDFVDMEVEEIYDFYEATLNNTFMNTDSLGNIKSYDLADGLKDLINEMDKGLMVGLPYYNLDLLNHETNGLSLGNLYMILGNSGSGKSSFIRSTIIPSILEQEEKLLLIINEEDQDKVRKELLIFTVNNILKKDLQKYVLNHGKFSKEVKDLLYQAADWLEEHRNQIIIVPLDSYTTDKAIKVIRKYSSLGIKYMVLDTFKHDSSSKNDSLWIEMMVSMNKLYDLIKPSNKNLCLICTMQLNKQSTKQRYLTLDNISSAKNTADVASCVIMSRWVMEDELEGGAREIKAYKLKGKTKLPIKLNKNKHYQIMFIPKNRFGATDFQIILEVDLSKNVYKEVGIATLSPDF